MKTASMIDDMRQKISRAIELRNTHHAEIPRDELIIVGGAALQMHGIKQTTDIDVVVTPERLEQVLTERFTYYRARYQRELGRRGTLLMATGRHEGQVLRGDEYGSVYGGITYMLAPNDHLYQATFEELRNEAMVINGILVSPPERILAWKRGVNRPKDAADITLIERYLASR